MPQTTDENLAAVVRTSQGDYRVVVGRGAAKLHFRVDIRQRADEVERVGEAVSPTAADLDRAAVDAEVEALVLPFAEQENAVVELIRARELEAVAFDISVVVELDVEDADLEVRVVHLGQQQARSQGGQYGANKYSAFHKVSPM